MIKRKPTKVYSEAIKQRVVERVRSGERVSAIANDTKIHYSLIYAWMKKAGVLPAMKKSNGTATPIPKAKMDGFKRMDELRDAMIYLKHARREILAGSSTGSLSRANLLTLLALDTLEGR